MRLATIVEFGGVGDPPCSFASVSIASVSSSSSLRSARPRRRDETLSGTDLPRCTPPSPPPMPAIGTRPLPPPRPSRTRCRTRSCTGSTTPAPGRPAVLPRSRNSSKRTRIGRDQKPLRQHAEEALSAERDPMAADWFKTHPPVGAAGQVRAAELLSIRAISRAVPQHCARYGSTAISTRPTRSDFSLRHGGIAPEDDSGSTGCSGRARSRRSGGCSLASRPITGP